MLIVLTNNGLVSDNLLFVDGVHGNMCQQVHANTLLASPTPYHLHDQDEDRRTGHPLIIYDRWSFPPQPMALAPWLSHRRQILHSTT